MDSSLNAARRSRELRRVAEERVDVLVVGLGATGAGAALDAASRGLSVAAIDAHDLAFGTSRWSSKMVHGGLRYLAKGQVGVAHESAVERGILLRRTAPHLVRAHPYLLPLTPAVSRRQAALVMTGYRLGDGLRAATRTPRRLLPGPTRLNAARAHTLAPILRTEGLRGALLSWDGRLLDDARLVVALARTAAAHGARVLTRCRALRLTGHGAQVRDELTGEEFTIRATVVINAAGVWAGGLDPQVRLRPSRGSHLVLEPGTLPGLIAGVHVPVPGESNRFALVLPQPDGRIYVGLTDEPVDGPVPDVPEVPEEDVRTLLGVLNGVLEVPVTREAVAGAYAGLRPLLAADGRTADLSREHAVFSEGGVVTVVGGKLTTYRRMAEDAVDRAVSSGKLRARRCRTRRIPLVGAGPRPSGVPARLAERYGAEAGAVHALVKEHPEEVGLGLTKGELLWSVLHEGALDEGDLLDRRTRIGLVGRDRDRALPATRDVLERFSRA
ncbi:glycerol-3-phosphate dehydrogenase/oxidase [Nonomuraea gerenzanensis]|uniref:Glycerol-3-phosphate dehydrogenase n=1 Tax=Nonomuraea gerenzanensis TaxID=93944 RepID=A0A1M4EJJ5_9ACTN|nr:glycerol-3-phosphate dehydrogenase/oxidase [Nonomuraea gerenzanensis]UBU10638.1 glycerol-3-phosphate dehydrogenase/oxidase [Nonomuraea gerenzanensis]SBO99055.1 Glycerol-3-phosphate dehydrogenase [Nonomuraea gerenzanensis]